ncbi:hypothetical protein CH305_01340 [Rhodococcus sp. 15-649-2-2]|uniref:hypothetical protein n=1 Tax=Rhodococcus sp. 15-649-2-2 TaxID=2023140 RepID=UPI000B9C3257|nr:hypothetical protein [Rhodococcus sp. 15-649-2-2]OZE87829.1 hypothetical protein CH305_01340 [Rhodococcus sp. 15-649-2-2]
MTPEYTETPRRTVRYGVLAAAIVACFASAGTAFADTTDEPEVTYGVVVDSAGNDITESNTPIEQCNGTDERR